MGSMSTEPEQVAELLKRGVSRRREPISSYRVRSLRAGCDLLPWSLGARFPFHTGDSRASHSRSDVGGDAYRGFKNFNLPGVR